MRSLATSVFAILVCIACLCSSTFAWFNVSQDSQSNTIAAGSFDYTVEVQIAGEGGTVVLTPTEIDDEHGTYYYTLAAGTYDIILDLNNDSTAKGYCIIKIGEVEKQTDVIIGDNTANREDYNINDPFSFTLVIEEDDTVVEFRQHWEISASSSIEKDSTHMAKDWVAPADDTEQN